MIIKLICTLLPALLVAQSFGIATAFAQSSPAPSQLHGESPDLDEGFENPPDSARPRVWWHWMNGNVSVDGIEKDLVWLKRIGIGGVQNFDAGLGTPQIVDKRLVYMEPDWQVAFRHAVEVADREGLEFAIAASPGWSQTGGPWVPPEDAMKKLAWSEVMVRGGERFNAALPDFPVNAGHYQTVALRSRQGQLLSADQQPSLASGSIAVFAVPLAYPELPLAVARNSQGDVLDGAALVDSALESSVTINAADGEMPGSITLEYPSAVTVRSSFMFVLSAKKKFRRAMYAPELQAFTNGDWRKVAVISLSEIPTTTAFAPVTASRFRVLFHPVPNANAMNLGDGVQGADNQGRLPAPFPDTIDVGDLRLLAEPRIDQVEHKANFAIGSEFYPIWDHSQTPGHALDDIIDVTDRLRADGTLDWTAPGGTDWRLINLGWSITGERNHPASPEATGLEVDKFDAAAVRRYVETYLALYRDAVGPDLIGKRGLNAILTDSIEVGGSNWTPDMFTVFASRRGYDLRPWLPALLGHVMISPDASERFLYDFRLTLTELMTQAHYVTIAQVAHENDMTVYGEALEGARPALGDDLAMRSHTDIPMAAMWMFNPNEAPRSALVGDIKGAASVAQIYGQNIVAAESLTAILAPWAYAPKDLKRVMDFEFALGVNRPVIHTSVHQPSDDHVPGLSLGSVGQYFNRHETWAEMAGPWVQYMASSSFMLQQGFAQSDIAYFYGEETPITQQFANGIPSDLPQGFGYDFVNAQILVENLSVDEGVLVVNSPGTGSYRALYLGGTSQLMTLNTLERIAQLVEAGALVIGEKPVGTPNLLDDQHAFAALANRLWADGDITLIGKGTVMRGGDPQSALLARGIPLDFAYRKSAPDSEVLFRHRKLANGDIYFLTNRRSRPEPTQARFRVTGRLPELWNAVTRTKTPLSFATDGAHTVIDLELAPEEAVFIVFREPTKLTNRIVDQLELTTHAALDGPWQVSFQPGRGAPAGVAMARLTPLEQHDDTGIRYFSGISTYLTKFTMPDNVAADDPIWLDLGEIGDVAEVHVNGDSAGIAWFAPYRVDVTGLVEAGENTVEIKIANRWINRLIGDKQPGADGVAFVTSPTYDASASLRSAGLIGPVRLVGVDTVSSSDQPSILSIY